MLIERVKKQDRFNNVVVTYRYSTFSPLKMGLIIHNAAEKLLTVFMLPLRTHPPDYRLQVYDLAPERTMTQ